MIIKFRINDEFARPQEPLEITIDTEEIEEALEKANPEELAKMVGTGVYGFKTYLMFDPQEAKFKKVELTSNTRLRYPYLFPVFEIIGEYDVPYTLSEALENGWLYYRNFEPFKEWLENSYPEFLERLEISSEEVEKLIKDMPDELKEKIWEEELVSALAEDISESLSGIGVGDILDWLRENGEEIQVRKIKL